MIVIWTDWYRVLTLFLYSELLEARDSLIQVFFFLTHAEFQNTSLIHIFWTNEWMNKWMTKELSREIQDSRIRDTDVLVSSTGCLNIYSASGHCVRGTVFRAKKARFGFLMVLGDLGRLETQESMMRSTCKLWLSLNRMRGHQNNRRSDNGQKGAEDASLSADSHYLGWRTNPQTDGRNLHPFEKMSSRSWPKGKIEISGDRCWWVIFWLLNDTSDPFHLLWSLATLSLNAVIICKSKTWIHDV